MTHWNYRVLKKYHEKTGTTIFQIHEVYYNEKNQVEAWAQSSVGPSGDTISELEEDVKHFMEAIHKPVFQEKYHKDREILVELNEK